MDGILEGSEHLERELTPEPIAAPAMGSFILHGLLIASVLSYGLLSGIFKHNVWGNQGGGAMQVNLVSSAIPLPSTQPVNQNVLATEKPSKAPVAPAPKTEQKVDETAIPIQGKEVKPQEHTTQKAPPQQAPKTNTAQYGEQSGTSIPRATQPSVGSIGQTAVGDSDFVSMFGYYVRGINSKMSSDWYKQEVDPRTPPGARIYLFFMINKDGTVGRGSIRLDRSSGSPTLDQSCMRAAQRVDTFGPLPSAYNKSSLMVSYYCEY